MSARQGMATDSFWIQPPMSLWFICFVGFRRLLALSLMNQSLNLSQTILCGAKIWVQSQRFLELRIASSTWPFWHRALPRL